MIFRNASIEDLEIIVDIYNSTIASRLVTADLEPVSVASKLTWFHQHQTETRPLWIVSENNETIGWISFQDFYGRPAYQGTAEISIYIHEKYRGKGYGKLMLAHVIKQCNALKITTLLGFIFEHNKASISLFEKFGFKEWGNLDKIALLDDKFYSLKILGLKINNH